MSGQARVIAGDQEHTSMGDTLAMDLGDGPLQRQRAAAALVHEQVTAETEDHEDHTFAVR